MAAGKGYGSPAGAGMGRGVFSEKAKRKSIAPVPRKGSELDMKNGLMGSDRMKADELRKAQARKENERGQLG